MAPHAARRAAGLGVGEEPLANKDECLLFKIKQQDYYMSDTQWTAVSPEKDSKSRLEALTSMIETELHPTGTMPIAAARINAFEVFELCVKIISSLSDASHTDPKEQGINCLCFASAIIDGGDRIIHARNLGNVKGAAWTKCERESVLDLIARAIKKETAPSKHRDICRWTWSI